MKTGRKLDVLEIYKMFSEIDCSKWKAKTHLLRSCEYILGCRQWLKQVTQDEELNEFLIKENITCRYNLLRALWRDV